jgi:hypothetical protein
MGIFWRQGNQHRCPKPEQVPDAANLPPFFQDRCPGNLGDMDAPRQLSRQAVEEFKTIYREEFREDISDDQAQEIALRLLRLFDLLLQPPPGDPPGESTIRKPDC